MMYNVTSTNRGAMMTGAVDVGAGVVPSLDQTSGALLFPQFLYILTIES
jgi:hypothetical protein